MGRRSSLLQIYRETLYEVYVSSRMERDRTLLALSAAGVGFTVTLITAYPPRILALGICYAGMLAGFVVAILLLLRVLGLNSTYAKGLIKRENGLGDRRYVNAVNRVGTKINQLDRRAGWSFVVGVLFGVGLAAVTVAESLWST